MKKLLIVIALLLFSTYSWSQFNCTSYDCPKVGDPVPYNQFGTLDRYLNRSLSMDNIVALMRQQSYPASCQNATYCESQPYTSCPLGGYCPIRYCEDINLAVELNAQFLRRVENNWLSELNYLPGSQHLQLVEQTVNDINNAYDCAEKRRPIIQATAVLERVSNDVNGVSIPNWVIDDYAQFDPDWSVGLYNYGSTFDFYNMIIAGTASQPLTNNPNYWVGVPDLNKIETRMWFYYVSRIYIDLGFTALHYGWIDTMIINDNGNAKTFHLTNEVRDYALSLGSFVIIDAHIDEPLYSPPPYLVFDFVSSPIRPNETGVESGNCAGDYYAKLYKYPYVSGDRCNILNNNPGGVTPMNFSDRNSPYMLEFDHFDEKPLDPIQSTPLNCYHSWGRDDIGWFNLLQEPCQQVILEEFYCDVRNFDYRGYQQMPGRQVVIHNDIGNPPEWTQDWFRLHDKSQLINTVQNNWLTNLNFSIAISKVCQGGSGLCSIIPPYFTKTNKYTLSVTNGDCSSVYTWHIQNPDGSWQPYTFGNGRVFYPPSTGLYTVYIRNDSWGLPFSYNGTKQIGFQVYFYKNCCGSNNFKSLDTLVGGYPADYEGSNIPIREVTNFDSYYEYINTANQGDSIVLNTISSQFRNKINKNNQKTRSAIGTKLDDIESSISVFPNPTKDVVNISFVPIVDNNYEINLFDISGQFVKKLLNKTELKASSKQRLTFNLMEISNGMYFIVVNEEGRSSIIKKLVKF